MNNNFFIPPSPNWFHSQILACAPDNTLIYGTKNDVVVVHPTPKDESSKIEILPDEGSSQKVVCVDVSPKWDSPNKWVLCSWEDNVVKIWDMRKHQWKKCSPAAKGDKDNLVGARFLSEDRILSVTEQGSIIVCHIPQLKFTHLSNVFQAKVIVTCFAPCPHSSHLAAFGLKNGLIIVMDLRKNGTLIHKLRGHTGDVISLSWCPSPINIFPQKPGNRLRRTSKDHDDNENELSNNASLLEGDKECNKEPGYTVDSSETTKENCDDSHHENNSLIEKIENFIVEAETKSVEHESSKSVEVEAQEAEENVLEELTQKLPETACEADGANDSSRSDEPPVDESKDTDLKDEESAGAEDEEVKPSKTDEPIVGDNKEAPITSEKIQDVTSRSIKCTEEPRKELLLASCAKDGYINIWRAKTDGRLQCFFKINEKKSQNYKNKKGAPSPWLAIKWITPFSLLVSTKRGELLRYILPKPLGGKECTLVHNEHSNFIFAIAAHVSILTEENWFVENEVTIWTFSYDMFILNTVLDSKTTHLTSIETFCALVNCMAYSPVDPNRIALGLSNGTIKIWNANNSSPKFFSTANYSPKIYGKITYLEWHQTNELIIAFCTEEGTVGLINTNNKQKATWFKQYFSSSIHRIQWAPYANKTCLFAIAKGILVCFDPDDPKAEPVKLDLQTDAVPYYFSWKIDMSLMLLSHNCGKISVHNPDLSVRASYFNNKKLPFMLWHPESETTTGTRSFWVASAVDNVVYIFDFAEVTEKNGTLNVEDIVKTKISIHYGAVKSVAWNSFVGDQLVTAGEDGLAFVLDAINGTVLSSYHSDRFQPIKAIIWSPTEEDLLIMTMSRLAMLMGWQPSKYKGALSNEILKECENFTKTTKKSNAPVQKEEDSGKKVKKVLKSAKNVILPVINAGTSEAGEEKVKILKQVLEETEKEGSVEKSNFGKLFGTKDEVLSLLDISEKSHMNKGKFEAAATVSAFKGDLQNHINEAIEQYTVTPLLISLAPSVSLSLWQKACQTYANQLCGKPDADPLEVALYFLASQNIEQAIEYLCEKELFKEALALAKTKLPSDSVISDNIVTRWAQFSSYCGNLETGALCYIKLGKYDEAVKMLFRRNDSNILSLALELARKTGNQELIKAVEFRYNAFSKNSTAEIHESDNSIEEVNGSKSELSIEFEGTAAQEKACGDKVEGTADATNGNIEKESELHIAEGDQIKIETNISVLEISTAPEKADQEVSSTEEIQNVNGVYY